MANNKGKVLKVKDVVFRKEFYPRQKCDWQTMYDYAQSMKAGANFPPIEVAFIRGKHYLLDGLHRLEALKYNKEKYVQAIINPEVTTLKALYVASVSRNIINGRRFSVQEKAQIIVKLRDMQYDAREISKIVCIPAGSIDKFVADRVTNTISGKTVVLKGAVKHFSAGEVEDDFDDIQDRLSAKSQLNILDQFLKLLENGLFDFKNKQVMRRVNKIRKLLII
jgi:hypothetical protein